MSSWKNTPEKQTSEEIEREVNRRVQKTMMHILNDISTSRPVAGSQMAPQQGQKLQQEGVNNLTNTVQMPHHSIPEPGRSVPNLIGDFQQPLETYDRDLGTSSTTQPETAAQKPILNQQWEEPPHMQPPMVPPHPFPPQQPVQKGQQVPVQSTATNSTSVTNRQVNALRIQPNTVTVDPSTTMGGHPSIPVTD